MIQISQGFRKSFALALTWVLFFSASVASFYAKEIPLDRALDEATAVLATVKGFEIAEAKQTEPAREPPLVGHVLLQVKGILDGSNIQRDAELRVSVLAGFPGTATIPHKGEYGIFLVKDHNGKWIFASPGEHFVRLDPSTGPAFPSGVSAGRAIASLADANLSSASPAVVTSCLRALWRLAHVPSDVGRLRELSRSPDLETRAYAACLLWRSGSPGGLDALNQAASDIAADGNPILFSRFLRSLEDDRDTQIMMAIRGLESPSYPLESGAIDVLRRQRARSAIAHLRPLLDSPSQLIRSQAYITLWEMLGSDRLPALRAYGVDAFAEHEKEAIPLMKENLDRLR